MNQKKYVSPQALLLQGEDLIRTSGISPADEPGQDRVVNWKNA